MKNSFVLAFALALPIGLTAPASNAETEMLGAWQYDCAEICRAMVGISKNDQKILAVVIETDPKSGKPAIAVRVPLGALLQPGLRIYGVGDTFIPVPFHICMNSGCEASLVITDEMANQFNSTNTARISYFVLDGGEPKGMNFEVPFAGVGQVIERLVAHNN